MKHKFSIVAETIAAVLFAATLTGCGGTAGNSSEPAAESMTEQTELAGNETTAQNETAAQTETTAQSTTAQSTTTTGTTETEATAQTESAENADTTSIHGESDIPGESETAAQVIPEPTAEDEGGVFDVDRGFFVTKITVPASLLADNGDGGTVEEKAAKAKAETDYILDAEVNGDNVIYTIKTSEYNRIKRETKAEIVKQIDDIVNDSTNKITRVEYDGDFANIYCYVTSESEYQSDLGAMNLIGVVLSIGISNVTMDFFADKTTLHVIDNQTGAEFVTKEY